MATDFVHLRTHSIYSLAQGVSKAKELAERAVELGMPALALVDRNNLYGTLEFSTYLAEKGVQPIIGMETSLEVEPGRSFSVSLLATNEKGFANLSAALRKATEARPNSKGEMKLPGSPSLPLEHLQEFSDGLILLTGGGRDGFLPSLARESREHAEATYRWLLALFGDRMYVEICRNGDATNGDVSVEEVLIDLAYGAAGPVECLDGVTRSEAPLVATTDIWHAREKDRSRWLIGSAMSTGEHITVRDGGIHPKSKMPLSHIRSADEMRQLFADLPEAYANTVNLARRCAYGVSPRKPILPPFPTEGGRNEAEELRAQAKAGLESRIAKMGFDEATRKDYFARLDFELDVIVKMGFPGYFLIVSDFIIWSKQNGIPVGPGRGSGAGSIAAWALRITDLDPIRYGLLFERFLNPDRVSMPDFDIDFCQDRRDEVIEYVRQRYGDDKVAQIATFTVAKSKGALKAVQRILQAPDIGNVGLGEAQRLTNLIPNKEGKPVPMDLKEAYDNAEAFRKRVDESPQVKTLYEHALLAEGLYTAASSHAAGVVIGDRPLTDLVPVMLDPKTGKPVAGFNMKGVETVGLVKFDFLGLTTMSIIAKACKYIKEHKGHDIELTDIPMDDPASMAAFARGETTAIFQFESAGMRGALKEIRAARFEDLIAVVALYRPGPMQYIPLYANRKRHADGLGGEPTEYPMPEEKTKPILEETYGIMVYQEQVMQVAQAVAGYSLGGADLLRRAMGKKIEAEMKVQRQIFINGDEKMGIPGAVKHSGLTAKEADTLFDDIMKFADYGFNKSHAAAYALISYWSMYLKTHYPVEYFAAFASYECQKTDKKSMAVLKEDMDRLGVELLPVCVNKSYSDFVPEKMARCKHGAGVRFGLKAVKLLSGDIQHFLDVRKENGGEFLDLDDFHHKMGGYFNTAKLTKLAEVGAFSELGENRRTSFQILSFLSKSKPKVETAQADMFGLLQTSNRPKFQVPPEHKNLPEWTNLTEREFNAVGFYCSEHPIDLYVAKLIAARVSRRSSYGEWMVDKKLTSLRDRFICGTVMDYQERRAKSGTTYISVNLSEKGDSYNVACFEGFDFSLDEFRSVLANAKALKQPIVMECKLSLKESGEVSVQAYKAWGVQKFIELSGITSKMIVTLDREVICAKHKRRSSTPEGCLQEEAIRIEGRLAEFSEADGDIWMVRDEFGWSYTLPGRYSYPQGIRVRLGATPGITGFSEEVTKPAQAKPASPCAGPKTSAAPVGHDDEEDAPIRLARR